MLAYLAPPLEAAALLRDLLFHLFARARAANKQVCAEFRPSFGAQWPWAAASTRPLPLTPNCIPFCCAPCPSDIDTHETDGSL